MNSIPRHVAEEDEFVSHHCIATERTVIPGKNIKDITISIVFSMSLIIHNENTKEINV